MYAIAGATGRVGSVTAQILLNAGVDVRVLVRRKSDAEAWETQGAETRITSLEDQAVLSDALDDVAGFFVLLPFDLSAEVLLQLGAGAKKAPFLLCDQRYVPVLSGRLEYPANNHCIRIRVTIGKHRALPLPQ